MAVAMTLLIAGAASLTWAAYAQPGLVTVPVVPMPEEKEERGSAAAGAGSSATYGQPDDQDVPANTLEASVTIHLVDEADQAVAGARVGVRPKWWEVCPVSSIDTPSPLGTSDQDGFFRIQSVKPLKPSSCDPTVPCFAFHQDRQLAGTLNLTTEDWGKE